jgi:glycosyltransferase involved in cell wall biosynthesis
MREFVWFRECKGLRSCADTIVAEPLGSVLSLLLNKVDEIVIVDSGSSDDVLSKVQMFKVAPIIKVTGGIGQAKDKG